MKNSFLVPLIVGFALGLLFAWVFNMGNGAEKQSQPQNQEQATQTDQVDTNDGQTEKDDSGEVDMTVSAPDDAGVVYELDTEASTLEWAAYRFTGSGHTGTVGIADGYMAYTDDALQQGEFVIDMTSITESEGNERFLQHIRSDDFFTVDRYPTSTLLVNEITTENGTSVVNGELTIRGITNEVSFPATIERSEDELNASAEFEIDRTKWGVVYDSGSVFKQLGDRAIEDEITYKLDIELDRVEE
jgi:polyisoprenoid-binding protein YceI